MDREAQWATAHWVTKSRSRLTTHIQPSVATNPADPLCLGFSPPELVFKPDNLWCFDIAAPRNKSAYIWSFGTNKKAVISLSSSYILETEMATHSYSCLENPVDGGAWWAAVHRVELLSIGLHRVGHNWSDLAAAAATYIQEKRLLDSPSPQPQQSQVLVSGERQEVLPNSCMFELQTYNLNSSRLKINNCYFSWWRFISWFRESQQRLCGRERLEEV